MVRCMGLPLLVVDAFASRPFSGNPAAVCVLPQPRDESWMQLVAREMNLSETAFVSPRDDGHFDLRWFTPAVEVALCGHATLATAHVLWESARVDRTQAIRFQTKSGLLTATRDGSGEGIVLDFPGTTPLAADAPAGLEAALGCPPPTWVGRERENVFVELARAGARVLGASPGRRARVHRHGARRAGHAVRLRFALLRAARGDQRRPGDRRRALCARDVLGSAPRKDGDDGISGVRSRRRGARPPGREPRAARR